MSFSTRSTAVEQLDIETELSELPKNDSRPPQPVSTDSTLPTHHLPPVTQIVPPVNNLTIPSSTNNTLTTPSKASTWMTHVKEYAPVVGVIGTVIGIIVAIITVAVK
jgi:hypothetical protein